MCGSPLSPQSAGHQVMRAEVTRRAFSGLWYNGNTLLGDHFSVAAQLYSRVRESIKTKDSGWGIAEFALSTTLLS